jgi:hypothetical protein
MTAEALQRRFNDPKLPDGKRAKLTLPDAKDLPTLPEAKDLR